MTRFSKNAAYEFLSVGEFIFALSYFLALVALDGFFRHLRLHEASESFGTCKPSNRQRKEP